MSNISSAYRLQHIVPASVVFLISSAVIFISFTQEPADAYIFPRLISVFFFALAIWNLARALLGLAKVGEGLNMRATKNFLPGVLVTLVFMLVGVKLIGIYVTSFVAFVTIYTLYDPAPFNSIGAWIRRIVVAAIFMVVIYLLFAKLLFVQTQFGLFF